MEHYVMAVLLTYTTMQTPTDGPHDITEMRASPQIEEQHAPEIVETNQQR